MKAGTWAGGVPIEKATIYSPCSGNNLDDVSRSRSEDGKAVVRECMRLRCEKERSAAACDLGRSWNDCMVGREVSRGGPDGPQSHQRNYRRWQLRIEQWRWCTGRRNCWEREAAAIFQHTRSNWGMLRESLEVESLSISRIELPYIFVSLCIKGVLPFFGTEKVMVSPMKN